ncbi:DUF1990 family protein [Deinococcus hopiensis]|uniref:DUF1990 domain-containing protein n=1 Tax=Deinococcus hopiensis KR-140 TaxID=695939 RepID=A0A1W1VQC4_9DEIO|nr:DUF1990 family protein [Deinococcus hopiensis]SMB95582.1 protein of unknown function [Deinococcus hopiensis KR-140]
MSRSSSRLRWLALPAAALAAYVLKGPADPLQPSGPEDGVGPITRRRYWVEVEGAAHTPEDVAEHWRNHLPDHAPKWLAWFRGLDHPVPPVNRGDRLRILMLGVRRGRVVVEHADPLGFRVRTLRLHPDAGTSDFRVYPGEEAGRMVLQIESLLRTNSQFDRLAYIFGVHAAQRRNWELTLTSVAAYAGGRIVNRGHESLEMPQLAHSYTLPEVPEAPVGASAETASHA